MTFGEALADIRTADRTQAQIAEVVLGLNAPKAKIAHYASYISRLERDGVPSPGLQKLREIGTALGFFTLTEFFLEIEERMGLIDGVKARQNLSAVKDGGAVPSADVEAHAQLLETISRIHDALGHALSSPGANPLPHRPAASARAHKP